MRHPKNSDQYRYMANDFAAHRFFHWHSVWYQARAPINHPSVNSVLEFGPGRAVTKALVEHFGIRHVGVDINADLYAPDVHSTIADFATDDRFDLVCAFEVLEHNPLEELEANLRKLASFSTRYVFVSLPFSGRWVALSLNVNLPRLNLEKRWAFTRERVRGITRPTATFRASSDPYRHHWWEIGDKNISKRTMRGLVSHVGLEIEEEFHNAMFPYHLFYLLRVSHPDRSSG